MDTVKRKTRWGRWLLGILLFLLVIGYCALWFVTKPMIEDFADNWIDEQRRAGFSIEHSGRHVEGFPFNFELVIDAPKVEAPGAVAKWEGEQLRLHSRPWNFYPMLANWWGNVEGYAPGKSSVQEQSGATHNLTISPNSRLLIAWDGEGLNAADLNLEDLSARIDGRKFETTNLIFAATPSQNLDGAFDLNLSWDSIQVPKKWIRDARRELKDAPPAAAAIASGILEGLESGEAANIPMPNALALGDRPMLFGISLN